MLWSYMYMLGSEGDCEPVNVMPSGGLCAWKGSVLAMSWGKADGRV